MFYNQHRNDCDRDEDCRDCGRVAECSSEELQCVFCSREYATARFEYHCTHCGNAWIIGRTRENPNKPVCSVCRAETIGKCDICDKPTRGNNAEKIDELIVCGDCFRLKESIWCPLCQDHFSWAGYLRIIFLNDPAGFHAAALVTHSRHEHSNSCGRPHEWSETNNRVMRTLVSAIERRVRESSYPATESIEPRQLINAFERLKDSDENTAELISSVLSRMECTNSSPDSC